MQGNASSQGMPSEIQREKERRAEVQELQHGRVIDLIQLIDELDALRLTASEIDGVLRKCGLDRECALREGNTIRGGGTADARP